MVAGRVPMMAGAVALDPLSIMAERILVVAPHPDDESLGCGGLIAVLGGLGRKFHVVFVTDGGASHLGSRSWSRERLAAQRRREAADAMEALGIADHPRTFLGLADAAMPTAGSDERQAAVSTLSALLAEFDPQLILVPWRRDPHCDHRDCWTLTHAAMSQSGSLASTLEYAVWLDEIGAPEDHPVPGEMQPVAYDITGGTQAKRDAVAVHLSQTTDLIDDDPDAFRLTPQTIERLTGPMERYWRPLP